MAIRRPSFEPRTLADMSIPYCEQTSELSERIAEMCGLAEVAMEHATKALLQTDLVLAEQVFTDHDQIVELGASVADGSYALLASPTPSADDRRTVLTATQVADGIARMGELARDVAKATRHRHPRHAIPEETDGYFSEMGRLAAELGSDTREVLLSRDPRRVIRIREENAAMTDVHRNLFGVLTDREWKHGVSAAVDVALLSRLYGHYGNHAVEVVRSVIFQSAGRFCHSEARSLTG